MTIVNCTIRSSCRPRSCFIMVISKSIKACIKTQQTEYFCNINIGYTFYDLISSETDQFLLTWTPKAHLRNVITSPDNGAAPEKITSTSPPSKSQNKFRNKIFKILSYPQYKFEQKGCISFVTSTKFLPDEQIQLTIEVYKSDYKWCSLFCFS